MTYIKIITKLSLKYAKICLCYLRVLLEIHLKNGPKKILICIHKKNQEKFVTLILMFKSTEFILTISHSVAH